MRSYSLNCVPVASLIPPAIACSTSNMPRLTEWLFFSTSCMPLRDQPVEGSRPGIDDEAPFLPDFRDPVMDVPVIHQRALRLWHHARPLHLHRLPAADVVPADIERADDGFHAFLQSASRALQGSPFAPFLSSRNQAFSMGLSASGRTVGALHCDYC